eukprot:TRINITY_DN2665_c0_g1_i1.p2 TRINITY_DN2665_c0_g1~~TRINITY_DN2665_c0_g1_i1.p2  ORF type:complete len:555 (+),score=250.61 TRINITY_DN2665_c0_g1_i1:83-1666(+)
MAATTEGGFAQMRQGAAEQQVDALAPQYEGMVRELRGAFAAGRTKGLEWRRAQLKAVQKMVAEQHEKITEAVRADLGGPKLRGVGELGAHQAAQFALDNLKSWAAPEAVTTPFEVGPTMMAKSFVRKEPKGVVLIISPWNYPFELAMHPLVAAIAAGCCVVIKPSEISAHTAQLIQQCVGQYLDGSCIKVVQGAVAETQALLRQHWDHIFYTGSGDVGRKVMTAAAQHLTPVTLELGGKSPVVIDRSAKLDVAASRVSAAKWFNVGQTCVAPDYVLVDKAVQGRFVQKMKELAEQQYGADPKASADWGRIVSQNHAKRIKGLMESAKGEIVFGGPDKVDVEARYVPPTLITTDDFDSAILQQEIFGPVLPVVGVDSVDDAIRRINGVCDRPLALYCFSEDKAAVSKVLDNTLSGGCGINTAMEQIMNKHLPFGGVGGSGTGAYHGKAGFGEFTHRRSCLSQDTLIKRDAALPPPPYRSDKVYDLIVRFTVLGFLTEGQRAALKCAVWLGAGVALASAAQYARQHYMQ